MVRVLQTCILAVLALVLVVVVIRYLMSTAVVYIGLAGVLFAIAAIVRAAGGGGGNRDSKP